jgi:trans-AT polyketide synthase/acyltransferase/oxidoreductase domain-containing protein
VEEALDTLTARLGDRLPWGMNLIHSPNEPDLEESVADLYIRRGVRRVSASAYMGSPSPSCATRAAACAATPGRIQPQNYVFAKISRPETARRFMMPAPKDPRRARQQGAAHARRGRAGRARAGGRRRHRRGRLGGHTDNQALTALFPVIMRCATSSREHGYTRPIRVGAAGGLGTPVGRRGGLRAGRGLCAHRLGEPGARGGLCEHGKQLLAQAAMGDVIMAPAADMFELGVKVQVLKRGTLFGTRAQALRDLHALREPRGMPADVRAPLEKQILGQPWQTVGRARATSSSRDPRRGGARRA